MLYKEAESSSVDILRVLTAQDFVDKLDKAQCEVLKSQIGKNHEKHQPG